MTALFEEVSLEAEARIRASEAVPKVAHDLHSRLGRIGKGEPDGPRIVICIDPDRREP